ncbi:hypothetical protein JJB11_21650 [Ramlibacter ginsenosidimutans]|uniref:histidine kinase n=1 Tax=Ramlibacter ginsenosidimutans TaxID=502333 RepID=A0A934TWG5_9BURK|nr:ATP-binding protein [Ramlibacter ginsenosidimutans]MBK6008713.1 hypothetical protein [Ramlibacter ginsenosidimutans]
MARNPQKPSGITSASAAQSSRRSRIQLKGDAHDELDAQELAHLRAIKDTATVWYWEQDSEFRFTVDIRGAGHVPQEPSIIGIRRWEAPDCFPLHGTWEDHRRCLEAHLPFREFEFQVGRGVNVRYISTTGVPVFEQGRFVGYRGTAMNITALKRAQQAYERAQVLAVLGARLGKVVGWSFDLASRRMEWSRGLGDLLSKGRNYEPGRSRLLKLLSKGARRMVVSAFWKSSLDRQPFDVELHPMADDGKQVWMRLVGEPVCSAGGTVDRIDGALQDISDSKASQERLSALTEQLSLLNRELGTRVQERTRELELVNADLRGFAHVLAHDLKAPLAAIQGFSAAMEEALAREDSARAAHFASRIRAGGQRMNDYVEALLSLAEMAQAPLVVANVDLTAICADVVDELRAAEHDRNMSVTIEEGMEVRGDRRLLRVLLENLIGNAWKFTRRREAAWIRISSWVDPAGIRVFSVQDNGAGFNMEFAGRLFGDFQRLHAADEFPGTGIGLSNAQRIVNRHGGRIWAEAREGEGAVFRFTLADTSIDADRGCAPGS